MESVTCDTALNFLKALEQGVFKKLDKCTFKCETLANANPSLVFRVMQVSETVEFVNCKIEFKLPLGHDPNITTHTIIMRDCTMGECEQSLAFTFPKKYFTHLKYLHILNTPLSNAYYKSIMSIFDYTNIQVLEIY